jgi:hypothetical protein
VTRFSSGTDVQLFKRRRTLYEKARGIEKNKMQKRRIFQESDERRKESQVESIDMDYTGDISQGIA